MTNKKEMEYSNYVNFIRDALMGISDRIEDPKERERVIRKVKEDAIRMKKNGEFLAY